jgi:hypothetical protein
VPLIDIDDILNKANDDCTHKSFDDCKNTILKLSTERIKLNLRKADNTLSPDKVKKIVDKFVNLVNSIVTESEEEAFNSYKETLQDVEEYIDQYTIGYVANHFNKDIYFFDSKTREPYIIGGCADYKNRESILILWIGESHYEVIGRVYPGTRKVQRLFSPDDPLIKKLYKIVCKK